MSITGSAGGGLGRAVRGLRTRGRTVRIRRTLAIEYGFIREMDEPCPNGFCRDCNGFSHYRDTLSRAGQRTTLEVG